MEQQIKFEGDSQRLDVFLTSQFSYSRNFWAHLIERGAILLNDRSTKKSYKPKQGDIIKINSLERFLSSEVLSESPNIDLSVKLEKQDYMVIYKPKGILSHPNSVWEVSKPSVVGFLYHRFQNLPTIGNFIRAGLIHRLDKETDGFMIIAKTEIGLKYFKDLFDAKSMSIDIPAKEAVKLRKFYKAQVKILPKGKEFLGKIGNKFPYYIDEIVKTKSHSIKEFKNGITKILDIKYLSDDKAEIDIEILTGRTHQIRYHLSSHGLPIMGDDIYGVDGEQMCLSSYRLEFEDVDGEYIIIQ